MTSPDDPAMRPAESAVSGFKVEREELEGGRYILYFSWTAEEDPEVLGTRSNPGNV